MGQPVYDVKNLAVNAPGKTRENSSDATPEAGLWRHPESGQEEITLFDPLFGNAQSEAYKRMGYVRVGDAPEGSVKTFHDVAPTTESADERTRLVARNEYLEQELAKQRGDHVNPSDATQAAGEVAKAHAVESHNSRDQGGQVAVVAGDIVPAADAAPAAPVLSDKALSKQNKTELIATAASEGLTVDSELSNKKIVEAIEANRTNPPAAPSDEESES